MDSGGPGRASGQPLTPGEDDEFRRLAAQPDIYEVVARSGLLHTRERVESLSVPCTSPQVHSPVHIWQSGHQEGDCLSADRRGPEEAPRRPDSARGHQPPVARRPRHGQEPAAQVCGESGSNWSELVAPRVM